MTLPLLNGIEQKRFMHKGTIPHIAKRSVIELSGRVNDPPLQFHVF